MVWLEYIMRGLFVVTSLMFSGCEQIKQVDEKIDELGLGHLGSNYVEKAIGDFSIDTSRDPAGQATVEMVVRLDSGDLTCGDLFGDFAFVRGDRDDEFVVNANEANTSHTDDANFGRSEGFTTTDFDWAEADSSQTCTHTLTASVSSEMNLQGVMTVEAQVASIQSFTDEEIATIKVSGSVVDDLAITTD